MLRPDKDRPSAEWIRSLRARFPTESEIDRILTRKMERRSGPGYSPLPIEALIARLEALLHARLGKQSYTFSDARWLSGGSSKLQMAFTLEWDRPGVGHEKTRMVLRMEPAESIIETSRLREFQLIKAFEGRVPVPPLFWCDADAEFLPYPALVYGFAEGVTKPSAQRPDSGRNETSGVGIWLPPEMRAKLAPQFVDFLATIHTRDHRNAGLDAFDVPQLGTTQCAEWGMNWWDRVWEEDGDEEIPLLRLASGWLRRNMPVLDRHSIIHCDYRIGNFLFTEHDARISAWLDWELGRIGDRHQDLAWTTSRPFGGFDEDGKTFLVCGMLPEPEFIAAYERASGLQVDAKKLHWYKVYNNYSLAVLVLGTGYRIARNGKTHQDIVMATLLGIGYTILNQMREQIEEGR
ncbi:MAG: phosphotransferase family protein [Rhodocyclaceae bacterium]|jgi:aminoglycoside phosphotransferase (APT) family kinase protein|nr:phosphotransferase family protein [Rhodocyclaceae bacterium]